MGALLLICYIFSEHHSIRTFMEGVSLICRLFIVFTQPIYITVHNFILFMNIFWCCKGANLQLAITNTCLYSSGKAALWIPNVIVIAYKKDSARN